MEQTFKLEINAVSPDGKAVNCQSNIKINCDRTMSVSIIANLLSQEPKMKLLFAEAVLLSLCEEKIGEPISSDEFLDSILKAKAESKTEL